MSLRIVENDLPQEGGFRGIGEVVSGMGLESPEAMAHAVWKGQQERLVVVQEALEQGNWHEVWNFTHRHETEAALNSGGYSVVVCPFSVAAEDYLWEWHKTGIMNPEGARLLRQALEASRSVLHRQEGRS